MERGLRASIVFSVLAGACGGDAPDPGPPDAGIERSTVVELPVTANHNLDLLFVVDDSLSLDQQNSLKAALPSLLDRLAALPGGLPSLHVGVVSPDMGTTGSESPVAGPAIGQLGNGGCAGAGKGGALQVGTSQLASPFLVDVAQPDGTRLQNYTGPLAETLARMMSLGAGGCGFEQPLAAMRAALSGHPMNAGFLRPDAMLAVVVEAEEDDCSVPTPALLSSDTATLGAMASFRCARFGVTCETGGATSDEMNQPGAKSRCGPAESGELVNRVPPYRDFLVDLKGSRSQLVVAGILGPAEPFEVELRSPPGGGTPRPALAHSCRYQASMGTQVADPGVRLASFVDAFGDRSTKSSVCKVDLSSSLEDIGLLVARAMGSPCIESALVDTDPAAPGLQPDCVVEELRPGAPDLPIPPCSASPAAETPCWRLEPDAATCPRAAPNLKLTVERSGAPDPATVARMRCLVAP